MTEAALVVVFIIVGLAGPLVLYALVRAEGPDREDVSRADAERAARRDTDDRER
jgi:hypothetical protein